MSSTEKTVLVSRGVAARITGLSVRTLRRYEAQERPRIESVVWVNPGSGKKRIRYRMEDVARLRDEVREEVAERESRQRASQAVATATKEEGQRAAKVFRALREGKTTNEIVELLEEDPVFVDRLYERYHRPVEVVVAERSRISRERELRAERRDRDREDIRREREEAKVRAASRPACPGQATHEILPPGVGCPRRCGFVRAAAASGGAS